ncbi:hypothetical protein ACF08M_33085 [Streptomyces sp. NPDC015032]|uniref:hypothetical protein n=1 Tax=Streptomyces sp. NPDC015032 TaxID=3364937 RepID=UPI0036FD93E6
MPTDRKELWAHFRPGSFFYYVFALRDGEGVDSLLHFWLTEDADPDAWTVVVWDKVEWRHYDMSIVALLIRALTKGDPFFADLIAPKLDHPAWNPRL